MSESRQGDQISRVENYIARLINRLLTIIGLGRLKISLEAGLDHFMDLAATEHILEASTLFHSLGYSPFIDDRCALQITLH